MTDHTDLIEQIRRWDDGQLPIQMETLMEAARLVANLPNFPGFDRWYDWLVTRDGSYIDEYKEEDDGLIEWVAAVLVLFKAAAHTPPGDD